MSTTNAAVRSFRRVLAAVVICLGATVATTALHGDDNWPQFRGPTGLGYTTEKNLPVTWGGKEDENVLWKSPLVGQGHASPIVWGGRVFICTANWPADVKQREKVIPEHHVLCYNAADGKLLWDVQVPPGPWVRSDFRSGPGGGYACPTPTTDGKLVYCAFGSSVIAALDFQGKIVWRKEIVPFTFDVTIGGSPVLYGNTVVLLCAMAKKEDSKLMAFGKFSGEVKWEAKFPKMGFGHSTPLVIQVKGKPQMLVLASGGGAANDALIAVDPADGKRLWSCWGGGDASSPAFGAGIVYFDSGRGGPGVAVDPTGEGDVTATHIKWKVEQVPEGLASPVVVGQSVYRLHGPNIVKCWDAATGKQVFAGRLDGLYTSWASPVVDPAGRIFFATGGKSYVIQAGPELKVLATNDLGDGNHCSPAVAGGRMFLVGMKNVYCVGKK
jgi:outer membrane protein assembly factor BamB